VTIILVGLPGSGKSTAGRQLARHLDCPFVDSDHELERQLGTSIRDYFAAHGEEAFRDQEERAIDLLAQPGRRVLATGGGAVLRPANRAAMRRAGNVVVYLRSSPEELARRLRHDTQRPLLQGGDALRKLRDLYRVRDPLYREVATFVLDAGRTSVPSLVHRLCMQMDMAGLSQAL
jgi:shikimate kinase